MKIQQMYSSEAIHFELSFSKDWVRAAEVVWIHVGPSLKSLDSDKNFKPQHTLFCPDIKIHRDLRTFWKTLGKKSAHLGHLQWFLDKKGTHDKYIIYTELNLQIWNYVQKRCICCENSE